MASNYESTPSEPLQQRQLPSQFHLVTWNTFKHHIPRLIIIIVVDLILPVIIYFSLASNIKPVYALLAAGIPPFLMVVFKAVWKRNFDSIGFIVCITFTFAAILALTLDNPKILLLEKSLITGALAIIFGITLIPFRCGLGQYRWRPIVYYFYHDLVPVSRTEFGLLDSMFDDDQYTELRDENRKQDVPDPKEVAQVYAWIYDHCSSFRISCYLMTGVWAVGFCIECIVRYILIASHFTVNEVFLYGKISFIIIIIICATLQICCVVYERKHILAHIEHWKMENLSVPQSHPSLSTIPTQVTREE
ncbi:unnamed protein product [Adineta steineri]|uniref:Transmembrane protein n=2 Tax=Adineta steineri TaxID=433720 RepID=A0A813P930_9BILA|nr:unnamed protein product [Adineta steineri]